MSEATAVKGGPPTLAAPPGDALPPGARLAEFEIRSVLGAGGFGIVYLAWDHALEREVALKEYMPASLAGRAADGRVTVRTASNAETFSLGLRSFVNEARLLARFDHASLVKVYRFFEGNGTAYMAMPMIHGRTLRQVRQAMPAGSPGEAWARAVLEPMLGALALMHREEIYHRDIAPDNILLTDSGRPVLLDFGAARRVIGDRSHAVTAIVKPNFAPIEQYADVASVRQGPWTDLYALAATMYYLLSGQPPLPAAARALHDELMPLSRLQPADCSQAFLEAIDWALAVRPKDRPQSLALWRDVLEGRMAVPATVRSDVTLPSVAHGALARTGSVPDFDPTQPWPGFGGRVVTAPPPNLPPLPASITAPSVQDLPSTQPAALDEAPPVASTATATVTVTATAQPAAGATRRWRLPALALGAAAVAVFAGAAWRWSASGTAADPVASAPVAAASAPASAALPSAQASLPAALPTTAGTSAGGPGEPVETVLSTRPAAPPRTAAAPAAAPSQGMGAAQAAAPIVVLPPQPEDLGPPAPRERARTRVAERQRDGDRDDAPPRRAALKDPSDRCADRNFLLRPMCMKHECDSDPRLRHHPECVRMQQAEQERRDVLNR